MKLFRILELNGAPKASWTHTVTFLFARDHHEAYYWVDNACNCDGWEEAFEDDDELYTIYDENYNAFGEENYQQKIIRECGQLDDENAWGDAYYGVSLFGWEEMDIVITDELLASLDAVGMLVVVDDNA